jgi:hypothetical protein
MDQLRKTHEAKIQEMEQASHQMLSKIYDLQVIDMFTNHKKQLELSMETNPQTDALQKEIHEKNLTVGKLRKDSNYVA